jgi:hypothetical protein
MVIANDPTREVLSQATGSSGNVVESESIANALGALLVIEDNDCFGRSVNSFDYGRCASQY